MVLQGIVSGNDDIDDDGDDDDDDDIDDSGYDDWQLTLQVHARIVCLLGRLMAF